MANQVDKVLSALQAFKDWSNYLLVTTVAAVGWVASSNVEFSSDKWRAATLWLLGVSVIFGIFTLSLIPLVRQQVTDKHESIYQVEAHFSIFGLRLCAYLTQACRPQHIAFLAGIVCFCLGTTGIVWIGLAIGAAALGLGLISRPR